MYRLIGLLFVLGVMFALGCQSGGASGEDAAKNQADTVEKIENTGAANPEAANSQ